MSDLISRQDAIDGFYEMASNTDYLCTVSDYIHFLETMTSASECGRLQKERKIELIEEIGYAVERLADFEYCRGYMDAKRKCKRKTVDELLERLRTDITRAEVDELPRKAEQSIVYKMGGNEYMYLDDKWVCLGEAEE